MVKCFIINLDISALVLELDIDTREFGTFSGNGVATEVKPSSIVSHVSLIHFYQGFINRLNPARVNADASTSKSKLSKR